MGEGGQIRVVLATVFGAWGEDKWEGGKQVAAISQPARPLEGTGGLLTYMFSMHYKLFLNYKFSMNYKLILNYKFSMNYKYI